MKAELAEARGESVGSGDHDLDGRGFELLRSDVEETPVAEIRWFAENSENIFPIAVGNGIIAKVTEIWHRDGSEDADDEDEFEE